MDAHLMQQAREKAYAMPLDQIDMSDPALFETDTCWPYFERLRKEFDFSGDDSGVAKCFVLWAGLIGAISLEVFGQYGPDTLTDPADAFDLQVNLLTEMLTR